ncbi:MAG TPA: FMN-binding protein [Candidatus Paceibacterota bacterium]|nr:FMN-binding protein [Candidatus Paceibacterota bacterium]
MKTSALIASIAGLILVGAIAFFTLGMKNSPQNAAATTPDATEELTTAPANVATSSGLDTTAGAAANASGYKDGTYTASASYRTPETIEPISVTLTLANGIVTDVSFTSNPQASEARQYQAQFAAGYKQYVVGKNIDDIEISRVSGSSLTSGGFKAALEKIKAEAKA